MLNFLHIENIAVIKKLDIDFESGFNVLTGETGAGKSIIIDSIGALLGKKLSKDMIRHGEERAVVSACFSSVNETDSPFSYTYVQRFKISSGAPLVNWMISPFLLWTVVIIFLIESKGTSPIRGYMLFWLFLERFKLSA